MSVTICLDVPFGGDEEIVFGNDAHLGGDKVI